MGVGSKIRLSRLFSHPSGNLFGGAVDHFVGYGNVRAGGLADLPGALARVMAGKPDYVSIQPGAARHLWGTYAGQAALVIQAGCFTPDDRIRELIASPEDAVRHAGATSRLNRNRSHLAKDPAVRRLGLDQQRLDEPVFDLRPPVARQLPLG